MRILPEDVRIFDDTELEIPGGASGIEAGAATATGTTTTKKKRPGATQVFVACTFCRERKAKCSGRVPCDRCVRAGRRCVFAPNRRIAAFLRRSKLAAATAAAAEQSASSTAGDMEDYEDEEDCEGGDEEENNEQVEEKYRGIKRKFLPHASSSATTTTSATITTPSCSSSTSSDESGSNYNSSSSSYQLSCRSVAKKFNSEVMLADSSSANFLMNIFVTKILPHFTETHALPQPAFFLSTFQNSKSPSAAMQRDGALAIACRTCGHEGLAKSLVNRMDQISEVVKSRFKDAPDAEALAAFTLYFFLITSEDMQKGMSVSQSMFAMHQAKSQGAHASTTTTAAAAAAGGPPPPPPPLDPVEALCSPLSLLDLSKDPLSESITPEEVAANVQHSAQQCAFWAESAEGNNVRLRAFVRFMLQLRTRLTNPRMRPSAALILNLTVDLQLLGMIIPPYLMEILMRHDPQCKSGLNLFWRPLLTAGELYADPPVLPPELASVFLRRVKIAGHLLALSELPIKAIFASLILLEMLHGVILLRSGNVAAALVVAKEVLSSVSKDDLNFFPPLTTQCLVVVAATFYEAGDVEGIDGLGKVLSQLQRSNPSVLCALSALGELKGKMLMGVSVPAVVL